MAAYVSFTIADQRYALPISSVESVVESPSVTAFAEDAAVLGIFDFRGEAVPLVDVKRSLGRGGSVTAALCVLVVCVDDPESGPRRFGALADRVDGVTEAESLEPLPEGAAEDRPGLYAGLIRSEGGFVLCLEPSGLAPHIAAA